MAEVIYKRGLSSDLNNVNAQDGQILVTTDTGEMYIDMSDDKINRKRIGGVGQKVNANETGEVFNNYDLNTASAFAHAEGHSTTASGYVSHAEGHSTTASGDVSHAEGGSTTASGNYSHAEGGSTTASGNYSHAEGYYTKASSKEQHVQGKCNIEDSSNTYADIIGNGKTTSRLSNAATVDWHGNAWYAGDVYVGSTSGTNKDEGSKKLATEDYVNSAISSSGGSGSNVQADWQQNDETANDYVKNRPGGYENFVEILPETTLEFSSTSLTLNNFPPLELNTTYTITYDNIDYVLTSKLFTGPNIIYIGNGSYDLPYPDTGEPFLIYTYNNSTRIYISSTETLPCTHTIKIKAIAPIKIDEKYLDIKNTNIVNGSAVGSLRTVGSAKERTSYEIGDYAFTEGNNTEASGNYSHAEGNTTRSLGFSSHSEGNNTEASGNYSHAEGSTTIASGDTSHAEGHYTTASGNNSHAEGIYTIASGDDSHAEGFSTIAGQMGFKVTACEKLTDTTGTYTLTSVDGLVKNQRYSVHLSSSKENCGKITAIDTTNKKITVDGYPAIALSSSSSSTANYITIVNQPKLGDIKVSGDYSHAEGNNTKASGGSSHAEGNSTIASGGNSHAEGYSTTASGTYSHAEGEYTKASGNNSHAEGIYTTASSVNQHVQGIFNIEDKNNTYADIIGNGKTTSRLSNAATVDWDGNAWYAGDVYVGSTSGTNKDEGSKKLATEEYVDEEIANFDFIKIVTVLPETGLVNRTYFVPKQDPATNDLYDEYMWVDGKWELITTKQIEVDLTGYVKNTDINKSYDPTSENAQSGKAVAEAIAPKLDNPNTEGEAGQILGLDTNLLLQWTNKENDFELIADITAEEDVTSFNIPLNGIVYSEFIFILCQPNLRPTDSWVGFGLKNDTTNLGFRNDCMLMNGDGIACKTILWYGKILPDNILPNLGSNGNYGGVFGFTGRNPNALSYPINYFGNISHHNFATFFKMVQGEPFRLMKAEGTYFKFGANGMNELVGYPLLAGTRVILLGKRM